jgi:predicted nuclease of predicted toxin-antitoxin system
LSLNIYLDDCAFAKTLVQFLQAAGHRVVTPLEAGTSGKADEEHFQFAVSQGLVLLTKNPDDFAQLHEASPKHAGILVIYQDNDPDRDMTYAEIVRAISNLESAGITLTNSFQVLNAWRY